MSGVDRKELVRLLINGERVEVEVLSQSRESVSFRIDGRHYEAAFEVEAPSRVQSRPDPVRRPADLKKPTVGSAHGSVPAPIPGVVSAILAAPGDAVETGDVLCRLEAMKMENNILAPRRGTVAAVHVAVGDEVRDGQLLFEIDSLPE